jgi:hypothetical protein
MLVRHHGFTRASVVQGNCGSNSNTSVLKDLEESTAGRVEYPPLKPFQCALVIDKPLLLNMNATLWLDSLYVAITRTRMHTDFSILEDGGHAWSYDERYFFITSSTFVGEGRGSARALSSNDPYTMVWIEGATEFCLAYAPKLTSRAVKRWDNSILVQDNGKSDDGIIDIYSTCFCVRTAI